MSRRIIATAVAFAIFHGCSAVYPSEDVLLKPLTRLHFGSCNKHDRAQPAWLHMAERKPQAFAWLGDIIYADAPFILTWRIPADAAKVQRFFNLQRARPEYADFAARHPIVGVWDDHDTGCNDADLRFFKKPDIAGAVPTALLNFLDEPARSARRRRAHTGLHASYLFGTAPRRVHLILLDNRSQRDPYRDAGPAGARNRTGAPSDGSASGSPRSGAPVGGPAAQDMLGPEQWAWLEDRLRTVKAEITIMGTGLQVLSRGDPIIAESWSRLPQSQARLMALLAATGTRGAFLLSGDVHFTEVNRVWLQYQDPQSHAHSAPADAAAAPAADGDAAPAAAASGPASVLAWPLYDFTSSGMTHSWGGFVKTTVVRTALMHTNRLRGDGLTMGEAAECDAALRSQKSGDLSADTKAPAKPARVPLVKDDVPPYCVRALADRERLRTTPGPFGDLFSSELNFAEIDIDWVTRPTTRTDASVSSAATKDEPGNDHGEGADGDDGAVDAETLLARQQRTSAAASSSSSSVTEQAEELDADATTLTVRGIGAETGRVLWELTFPLSHLYPQPVEASGLGVGSSAFPTAAQAAADAARADVAEAAAADAVAAAAASAGPAGRLFARAATFAGQLARPLTDLLFQRRFLANGIPLPTSLSSSIRSGAGGAPSAPVVLPAPAHAVAACAAARLDAGFTRDCALFMSGVRPLMGPGDSLRYYAGHAAIFTAVLGGLGGIFCSPLFLWLLRAQLPFMRLRWWFAAYAMGVAAAAHYIYTLG